MVKKAKAGQPTKYKKSYNEQAAKLCALGATDPQLADFFGVCDKTIDNWKTNHPEFLRALKESKAILDNKVVRSLFERAKGYSHPEEKVFCNNGEITTHETTKHYPPESTAMIFWLKNRQPEKWRDRQEIDLNANLNVNFNMNFDSK